MTKSLVSRSDIVLIKCQCGREYPFRLAPHARKISNKEKLKAGWGVIKKRFLYLFIKNIIVCPICIIENKHPNS